MLTTTTICTSSCKRSAEANEFSAADSVAVLVFRSLYLHFSQGLDSSDSRSSALDVSDVSGGNKEKRFFNLKNRLFC